LPVSALVYNLIVKLSELRLNPTNPRLIKDDKFKKLVQSIKDFPKMLELRPIIVDNTGLILGGNMRFRALQELKMPLKDEWVKVGELTDVEKRRFIVEDNVGFGDWDWDMLAGEYEKEELEGWGMDVDKWVDIKDFSSDNNEEVDRLDEKSKVKCPQCGNEFTP
jgi:ParB-like chromosome segregation protein Spo0J